MTQAARGVLAAFEKLSPAEQQQVAAEVLRCAAGSGKPPTLEELLRGITHKNVYGEWDTGPAVGREVW